MNKKYIVRLTAEERAHLHQMLSAGKAAARKLLHARILLKADASPAGPGWTDEHINEALEVNTTTIGRVRQQCVEHSLTAALERRLPCGHHLRRLDGEAEAHLIALACSPAPAGHVHWTIRLLADRLVELGYVERVGRETVRQVLKKTSSSPGSKNSIVFLLKRMPPLCARWKRCWTSTYTHMMHGIRRSVWTKRAISWSVRHGCPSQPNLGRSSALTTNMSDRASVASSCALSH
jgi:homeodomain-containing protein